MSAEMIAGKPYSFSTDLWSLGIILYDMLLGHPPFRGKNRAQLQKRILNDKIKLPSYLDSSTHSVLKGVHSKTLQAIAFSPSLTMLTLSAN